MVWRLVLADLSIHATRDVHHESDGGNSGSSAIAPFILDSLFPTKVPSQAKVLQTLNQIKMARITLYVVLTLFSVMTVAFLVALFVLPSDGVAKTILGGTDGVIGVSLRQIIKNVFPDPKG